MPELRLQEHFLRDMLPVTIELGRSFVRLESQSTKVGAKAIFALDNLWDGLGALTVIHPEMKYLFGKVTMYPNYSTECRDLLLAFLHKYFPESSKKMMEKLVANLQIALGQRIDAQKWMGSETKANAHRKLDKFYVKIGYPNKWTDFSALTIDPSKSYYDNVMACRAFAHSIVYDSEADKITITHDAHSRKGFALGAVLAAEYTAKNTGLLTIDDMFRF